MNFVRKIIRRNFICKFAFWIIVLVLYVVLFKNLQDVEYDTFDYDDNLLNSALDSINRGLDFFSTIEEDDLVFDVLIGIRIIIDQGLLLFKHLRPKVVVTNPIGTLNKIIAKSNDLFDKIYDMLLRTQADALDGIGHIIAPYSWSHWTVDSLCVDESHIYKHLLSHGVNESQVFDNLYKCLKQYRNRNCLIDDHCWNIMTEPGLRDYELSHQLMYVMLADKCGCTERINFYIKKFGQGSLLHLQKIFCSNIFTDTTDLATLTSVEPLLRDMFVENIAFCGILGFHQFTNNKNWAMDIIGWQDINGCWSFSEFREHHRRKRDDNVVGPRNCSLHLTTLALAALIVNVKNDFIQQMEPSKYNC